METVTVLGPLTKSLNVTEHDIQFHFEKQHRNSLTFGGGRRLHNLKLTGFDLKI